MGHTTVGLQPSASVFLSAPRPPSSACRSSKWNPSPVRADEQAPRPRAPRRLSLPLRPRRANSWIRIPVISDVSVLASTQKRYPSGRRTPVKPYPRLPNRGTPEWNPSAPQQHDRRQKFFGADNYIRSRSGAEGGTCPLRQQTKGQNRPRHADFEIPKTGAISVVAQLHQAEPANIELHRSVLVSHPDDEAEHAAQRTLRGHCWSPGGRNRGAADLGAASSRRRPSPSQVRRSATIRCRATAREGHRR